MLATIISDDIASRRLNVTHTNDMEMVIVPHWEDNHSDGSGPAPSPRGLLRSLPGTQERRAVPKGTPACLVWSV
jgi:hypothetical protein